MPWDPRYRRMLPGIRRALLAMVYGKREQERWRYGLGIFLWLMRSPDPGFKAYARDLIRSLRIYPRARDILDGVEDSAFARAVRFARECWEKAREKCSNDELREIVVQRIMEDPENIENLIALSLVAQVVEGGVEIDEFTYEALKKIHGDRAVVLLGERPIGMGDELDSAKIYAIDRPVVKVVRVAEEEEG